MDWSPGISKLEFNLNGLYYLYLIRLTTTWQIYHLEEINAPMILAKLSSALLALATTSITGYQN